MTQKKISINHGLNKTKAGVYMIKKNLLNLVTLGFMLLCGYSSVSMADYTIWYDNDTKQEHQLYAGNTLLTPPEWACGVKFTLPSYYRHLDNYYGTLDSADFYKDVYVWIEKAGCPSSNASAIEYVDGSQSFPPVIGATGIEITANHGFKWVDENGSWASCSCTGATNFASSDHNWGKGFAEIAVLKSSILKKESTKFDISVKKLAQLLSSLQNAMDSTVKETNIVRTEDDYSRLANIEENALAKLTLVKKQINQCVILAGKRGYSESAFRYCDLALKNLQQSKLLWTSRN